MRARRGRTTAVMGVLAVLLGGVLGAGPASAAPLEKGKFHDVLNDDFDCDGTPTHVSGDVYGQFTFVKRGPGLAYFRESVRGTVVNTNTLTGGTYTNIFAVTSHDLKVTDNGDGTLTILIQGTGSSRWYDKNGRFVLNDSGLFRGTILVDHNGTPDDPFDDEEIENSFVLVKASTGRNDTQGRDFCEDLVLFTT